LKFQISNFGWIVAAHLAFATLASAQSPAPDDGTSFGFVEIYILGGGPVGFLFLLPIELLSIATVAHVIEHFLTIQRDRLVPPKVLVELESLLEEERFEQAVAHCEANRNYVTNIVAAALSRAGEGADAIRTAAEEATDGENLKLSHKISWLSLYGNLGPMLGLFGTVVGMVMAFTKIAQTVGTPAPQELALGIFTALVTTIWGLIVAMPALGFFFFFKMRIQRLSWELSAVALEMVWRLRPVAGPK
jgi:biopolymer transport protein ExbB